MASVGSPAHLGILGEVSLLESCVVLVSVKLRVPQYPAPCWPEFVLAPCNPILGLRFDPLPLLDVCPPGHLPETLEAPAQKRLHLVEPFLLDLLARLVFLVGGLDLDVIKNALLAPRLAPVALNLVELVVEPLGLQGVLAVGLGDVLPQDHPGPLGFGPQ